MARTVEQIHIEYTQLCSKAGHLGYQIVTLQTDLDLVNEQLRDLNIEAATVSKEAKEAEKKDA